jgi:hypothetical protein
VSASHSAALDKKRQALGSYIECKAVIERWVQFQTHRIGLEQDLALRAKYETDLANQKLILEDVGEAIDGLAEEIKVIIHVHEYLISVNGGNI